MIEALLRVALVAVVVGSAFAAVTVASRSNSVASAGGLRPGLTLVTGPGCRLCQPAADALARAGVEVEITEDEAIRHALRVRSLPTAIVVDRGGSVVARRSGRAVIDDALSLASAVERALA